MIDCARYRCLALVRWLLCPLALAGVTVDASAQISVTPIGTYATGVVGASAAEIAAYDAKTRRLFSVNAGGATIDVLDLSNPAAPALLFRIDVTPYGRQANSVALHSGVLAVAVENVVKTDPGRAVFYDTDGTPLNAVTVGALPDMLTFTHNGRWVLVANEAEPNDAYTVDPEGSVSIIDVAHGARRLTQSDVRTARFTAFTRATIDPSIRIYGANNPTVAQDLEPEYIATSSDSRTAWVTLQENNAIGVLDIKAGRFTRLIPLGRKDHRLAGNALDASDRDGTIHIANWPVLGMHQPDAIATLKARGRTYLVTANEGDARDWAGLREEARVSSLALDPAAFPGAAMLRLDSNIGRLTVTRSTGDTDGDGDFDELHVFGGRSFSIWTDDGGLVFDSGDALEQITAAALPAFFNDSGEGAFDSRSDNKGPEPEGVAIGRAYGRTYAFIGLERIGGVAVFDVSTPASPRFVTYAINRADRAPEGLMFIARDESPIDVPLLVVSNEFSGTTTIYRIDRVRMGDRD